jgi:hypothetical protein
MVLTSGEHDFPFEYSVLVAVLLSLDVLGGEKSTGCGRCRIEVRDGDLCWNGSAIPLAKAMHNLEDSEWWGMMELYRKEMYKR